MNKQERVLAALNGKEVDHVPYSIWCHFGTQFLPGDKAADIEVAFYERYDLDFLKLMNDYPYPVPEGLDRIQSIEDWRKLRRVPVTHPCFSEQLKIVNRVAKRLEGEAFFVETVFSPFGVARRTAKDVIFPLMRSHPDEFKKGLEIIAESLCGYIEEVFKAGAAGIFFSINGAGDNLMSREEFRELVMPSDRYVIDAFKNKGTFNVAHVHGHELALFDEVASYPFHAFNWAHLHSAPSLSQARSLTDACLIGGIDECLTNMLHLNDLETDIKKTLDELGGKKMMLGPGCAVPPTVPPGHIDTVRKLARGLRK